MRNVHGGFNHPLGGVSPMKQEDKKEKVAYTGPALPERAPTTKPQAKQRVIKEGKQPAWYKDLFQSDNKDRKLSNKEKKEEKYALPSTPTWSKFENSKVGKAINAKGIVKEKDGLMRLLGYGKGEEKDLAMDATALVFPAADIVHATTKAAEGKYIDAGLYALFAAVPGAAGPLVNKAKKLLGVGDKVGAEKLLKETIKNNENAIKTNLKPKGGVGGGSVNPEWSRGAGRLNNPGKEGITTQMQGMVNQGKELDKMGYKANEMLNNKNIVFHGDPTKSGRVTVEVALPNGQTQMFYKSSGLAGKSGRGVGGTTEGMWQPFMGYSDEVPTGWAKNKAGDYVATGTAKANNWHVKSPGYEDFYGSKSYRDIAGNLDKIAAEEGWDMTGQLWKSNT